MATVENTTNVWVRFDFAKPVALSAVRIWNHNQSGLQNRGFRKVRLLTSAGGTPWATQADGVFDGMQTFLQLLPARYKPNASSSTLTGSAICERK